MRVLPCFNIQYAHYARHRDHGCRPAGARSRCPVAHTTSNSFGDAEKWAHVFDDPERDAWQKPHAVLRGARAQPDAAVADLGRRHRLLRRAPRQHAAEGDRSTRSTSSRTWSSTSASAPKREGLANLKPVQAAAGDARLPAKVDLVLLVDVYHHIEARERYFRRLAASLRPRRRVAVIDFRLDSPEGPPKASRIAPEQVKAELARAGYALAEEHKFLARQYFLIFKAR
jgi:SAM-dependent methyltransferase